MEKEKLKKAVEKLRKKIEKNLYSIFTALIIFLLIIAIINSFFVFSSKKILDVKAEEIREANKPAEIQLVTIKADNCPACFDISIIIEDVKGKNVKVLEEETLSYNDDRAKKLISEYKIGKLPTIIVTGQIDKPKLNGFENIKDALIFTGLKPLYVDAYTGEIIGQVELINIIDSSCENCISLSSVTDSLGQAGVKVTDYRSIEYNSAEGKELINKFGVKQVPALLISEDIDYYDDIRQGLAQLDLQKKQGFYALHSTLPPYRDLATGSVKGLVSLIMLEDSSCQDCYDVSVNKKILQSLGVFISKESKYDISSSNGKQLIGKYKIEKVPIILLSPEASVYDAFVRAWKQVGSEEKDGWFIMRKPEVVGDSKSLITGEIIS